MDFTNKVVLVTGASAGIGEAAAILFARHGAKLSLVGTNEKNLQTVANLCEKEKGDKPLAIIADLSSDEGCERTAKETLKHFGKLDVLVNNAGIGCRATIQTTDMATFDRVFNLDVRGVYNLTRLLVPALIETKGNIINISSIVATIVAVGSLPYGMAKAALDHFTRLTSLELAPKGVRVNSISPGITVSKFVQRVLNLNDAEQDEYLKQSVSSIPMGEVCKSEDIAQTILHVASDNSRLLTGAIIPIDGCMRYGVLGTLMKKK